jgi:hypothetical protein
MLISFLPIALSLCLYTSFIKWGARLFRKTKITWKASFLYVVGLLLFVVLWQIFLRSLEINLPISAALIAGLILNISYGVWFFSKFAKTSSDEPINPIAAAKLTGVIFGLAVGTCLLLWLIATVLLHFSAPHP